MKSQKGISLTEPQWKWLEKRAKELHISLSDLLRRIVDEKMGEKK